MMLVGRRLAHVIEGKNQAEAELRSIAAHLRDSGESAALPNGETEEGPDLGLALDQVIARWQELCGQLMRTTLVGTVNVLFAPVFALIMCVPKYLSGAMPLGEVVQVAAAFVTVQAALNWLVDNYQRLADWTSSVTRVSSLLLALDQIDGGEHPRNRSVITGTESQQALQKRRKTFDFDEPRAAVLGAAFPTSFAGRLATFMSARTQAIRGTQYIADTLQSVIKAAGPLRTSSGNPTGGHPAPPLPRQMAGLPSSLNPAR